MLASNTNDTNDNWYYCLLLMWAFSLLNNTIIVIELRFELIFTIFHDKNINKTINIKGISHFSNALSNLLTTLKFSLWINDPTWNIASCWWIRGFIKFIMLEIYHVQSTHWMFLTLFGRSQFPYQDRNLMWNAISLLPSLISSTKTTNLWYWLDDNKSHCYKERKL